VRFLAITIPYLRRNFTTRGIAFGIRELSWLSFFHCRAYLFWGLPDFVVARNTSHVFGAQMNPQTELPNQELVEEKMIEM